MPSHKIMAMEDYVKKFQVPALSNYAQCKTEDEGSAKMSQASYT